MMPNVEKIRIFEIGFTVQVPENANIETTVPRTFYTFIKAENRDEALDKFRFIYHSLPGQYDEMVVNSQEVYDVALPDWARYLEHDNRVCAEILKDPKYMHDEFTISLFGGIEGLDY